MTTSSTPETGARNLNTADPAGNSADRERNAENLFKRGTHDDTSHPDTGKDAEAGQAAQAPRGGREDDAMSEFAHSDEGHEKDVESGPGPRVGVGRRDATFENDAGD